MQVLPIKLPDDLYQDLKTVSRATNVPMAEFIRQSINKPLKAKLKTSQLKQQRLTKNFVEYMTNNTISKKDAYPNLTDDQLLYGKGRKLWKKNI
ncbi:ribbon-helix-helix domain-containing protein [Patescibacteria group bacterium]|nr:ribbon-helix-helix domain-containing protein [Patescibacteria group bacterium]